ncbi:paraquat-inducible protein A [Fibrobacterota bacterium]
MRKNLWNILALILILISFGLLIPGIFLPVLTIQGSLSMPMLGTINLGSETRSILGTVKYLFETGNYLVSVLIFVFSVTVPFVKGILLLVVLLPGTSRTKSILLAVIRRIGKWSMADVFVVAVFLAYLASASMQVFKAILEKGFFFFLGYCLISVLATEFIVIRREE